MIQIDSIETPLHTMRCFQNDEGRLKVVQPDTVLAMGYPQPYLSRNKKRGSGFGKFLHGNVITKYKRLNLIVEDSQKSGHEMALQKVSIAIMSLRRVAIILF